MLHRPVSAGISLMLRSDDASPSDDLETAVTKLMELTLRSCDVTWGPGVTRTQHEYGTLQTYETQSPCLRVEVDVPSTADYAMATVWTDDPRIVDRLSAELLETEAAMRDDGDFRCRTGRSHPDFGYMSDTLEARFYELDQYYAHVNFDGPMVDNDGSDIEVG